MNLETSARLNAYTLRILFSVCLFLFLVSLCPATDSEKAPTRLFYRFAEMQEQDAAAADR